MRPCQVWERLHEQIEADQKVQECAHLLQWLSLALTVPIASDPSVLGIAAPLAPVDDHILLKDCRSILVQESMLVRYIPKTAGSRYLLLVLISKWVAN